jgi:hypothetical protein
MAEHVTHTIRRRGVAIVCLACSLRVERPAGVPDYSRAGMRRW